MSGPRPEAPSSRDAHNFEQDACDRQCVRGGLASVWSNHHISVLRPFGSHNSALGYREANRQNPASLRRALRTNQEVFIFLTNFGVVIVASTSCFMMFGNFRGSIKMGFIEHSIPSTLRLFNESPATELFFSTQLLFALPTHPTFI